MMTSSVMEFIFIQIKSRLTVFGMLDLVVDHRYNTLTGEMR